jgi:cysteinyl-tRNA synthetase
MMSALRLYNSLSRRAETFQLPTDRPVTIYVCGVTPYDTTHIGHASTYVAFDVLIRYLEYRGHGVRYVENVTDIDDDILRKAAQVGDGWRDLGNRWTAHFMSDLLALNLRPPEQYVRATESIPEIVAAVQRLIDRGVAYANDGSVYFSVAAAPEFGQLSHLPPEERLALANERGNHPDDPRKRDPLDFVLWQAAAPGEPTWDSPWGPGRPGWHIECSSMIAKWLGPQIDIHGGGGDLLFPHHECELVQAEYGGAPRPFVRFWMHTGMVRYDGEKMSKSLGNLVMARDVLQRFSANALRTYLSDHRYRDVWEYQWAELDESATRAVRLEQAARAGSATGGPELDPREAVDSFEAALNADLGTPQALRTLDSFGAQISALSATHDVRVAQHRLVAMAAVLGLRLLDAVPEARVTEGWQQHLKRFDARA